MELGLWALVGYEFFKAGGAQASSVWLAAAGWHVDHAGEVKAPAFGFWGQSPNSLSLWLALRVRRFAPLRNWCLTPITTATQASAAAWTHR